MAARSVKDISVFRSVVETGECVMSGAVAGGHAWDGGTQGQISWAPRQRGLSSSGAAF